MIKSAIKPYNNLELIDLPDKSFSTTKTIPELTKHYLDSELFYLIGSSNIRIMATPSWNKNDLKRYFKSGSLIVALRGGDQAEEIKTILSALPYQPKELVIFPSSLKDTSSTKIREGLKENRREPGLLPSVYRYALDQWLYVSLKEG
jgi:nicotinic acid mononucleotide adenylyltransferase